jgi:hypothetical protein
LKHFNVFVVVSFLLALLADIAQATCWAEEHRAEGRMVAQLRTEANTPRRQRDRIVTVEPSSVTSLVIEVAIDPTENPSGDHQAVAGLAIGLPNPDADAFPGKGRVCFELREGATNGFWDIWIDGINEGRRQPAPQPAGWVDNRQYQKPWEFTRRAGLYRIRIIGAPVEHGTHLRFYFEHLDRPVMWNWLPLPRAGFGRRKPKPMSMRIRLKRCSAAGERAKQAQSS